MLAERVYHDGMEVEFVPPSPVYVMELDSFAWSGH